MFIALYFTLSSMNVDVHIDKKFYFMLENEMFSKLFSSMFSSLLLKQFQQNE
jgi:hypothetical protein